MQTSSFFSSHFSYTKLLYPFLGGKGCSNCIHKWRSTKGEDSPILFNSPKALDSCLYQGYIVGKCTAKSCKYDGLKSHFWHSYTCTELGECLSYHYPATVKVGSEQRKNINLISWGKRINREARLSLHLKIAGNSPHSLYLQLFFGVCQEPDPSELWAILATFFWEVQVTEAAIFLTFYNSSVKRIIIKSYLPKEWRMILEEK